jgi:hypothetical protein
MWGSLSLIANVWGPQIYKNDLVWLYQIVLRHVLFNYFDKRFCIFFFTVSLLGGLASILGNEVNSPKKPTKNSLSHIWFSAQTGQPMVEEILFWYSIKILNNTIVSWLHNSFADQNWLKWEYLLIHTLTVQQTSYAHLIISTLFTPADSMTAVTWIVIKFKPRVYPCLATLTG